MTLAFKKLTPNAVIPTRATQHSAGFDLCACIDETNEAALNKNSSHICPIAYKNNETKEWCLKINPHETVLVPTGLAVEPKTEAGSDMDIAMLIYARSGLSTKHGVNMANGVGVIDSDYRGEIKIPLHNNSSDTYVIRHGERIAQMLITPVYIPSVTETDNLNETERGHGGFGSTGA